METQGIEGQDFKRLQEGQRVKVVKAMGRPGSLEEVCLGRQFEFVRYTDHVGYALVRDRYGRTVCLHPEALEVVS